MRYLKNFKMFESLNDVDIYDIFPKELLEDLYDYSLEYFDKGLSLLLKADIGDTFVFKMVFDHNHKMYNVILDINNFDEILEEYKNGAKPKIEFRIIDDVYISLINNMEDDNTSNMGDYEEYDNRILKKVRLEWPDFDICICEYLYD